MKQLLVASLFSVAAVFTCSGVRAAQADQGVQDITVTARFDTTPVVIAGDPQLVQLGIKAFQVHGRYLPVAGNGNYTLTFSKLSATQVRVDIVGKNGAVVASQTSSGRSMIEAFCAAADAAVRATGGGNGIFSARLAFVGKASSGASEIYVGDILLNETRRVTDQHSNVLTPRWSPDGQKLLYTSFFKTGFPDIFQLDLSAGRWSTFVSFKGTNMGARYSPDGSRVAMVLSGDNGFPNLYTTGPDGRGQPTRLTSTQDAKASPCYSPDGRRIVFTMEPGPQLYLISSSGGTPSRISTGSNYCAEPDWSRAKPNLIAFTTKSGSAFRVAVYDMNTNSTRIIKPKDINGKELAGDFVEPNWLPDGRHVICTQRFPNQRMLVILDTEEKSSNRATTISTGYAERPSVWSQR